MKLGAIASIKVGLILSRQEIAEGEKAKATYSLLTARSINEDGQVDKNELQPFKSKSILGKHHLGQKGDVVIRLTPPYTAVSFDETLSGVIVSSLFAKISLDNNSFLPDFLAIYLNSKSVKGELNRLGKHSTSPVLKVSNLSELEIKEISLEVQKKIIEMTDLFWREKNLLNQLREKKETLYQEGINRLINQK